MKVQDKFIREVETHHLIIRKICLIYTQTKDDYEDLFQECLYNAWKSYPNFRYDSKFSTWLYKVTLNTALYHKRKNKVSALNVDVELSNYAQINDLKNDDLIQLYQAISTLNPIEKSVVFLYLEGMSYKEITEITGFTVSNVGTRLNRIKDKLKKILTNDRF